MALIDVLLDEPTSGGCGRMEDFEFAALNNEDLIVLPNMRGVGRVLRKRIERKTMAVSRLQNIPCLCSICSK